MKKCSKCGRELPSNTDYYFKKKDTVDGYVNKCKECSGYSFTNKLTNIPKEGYKFCIKCNREFPIDIKYFPPDKLCKDGLRNVCRECGKDGHFMEEGYVPKTWWTKEEEQLLSERYPHYTSIELIELFYPNETMKSLSDKAYKLGCNWKTEETRKRAYEHQGEIISKLFKGIPKSEETKKKLSETRKQQFATGQLISHWKGRIVSEEERKRISERKKGIWDGENNPRHIQPLNGELNGRWKGGIKPVYFYLRDFIKQWKFDSMVAYSFKCGLTGLEFDEIHHLTPFRDIVDEMFEVLQLDIRQTIGEYDDDELVLIQNKLTELHNFYGLGIPLCKTLHKLFHDTYGYTNTTPSNFKEFKINYCNGAYDDILEEKYKSFNSKVKNKNTQEAS